MDTIFDWVKSIVFYLILLTVVTHLLPGSKYEKYVKLFTGMLLVIIVIKPVTHIFSVDEIFDRNFVEMLGEGEEFYIDDTDGMNFENVQSEQLAEEYERQLEAFASSQAGSLGLSVVGFQTSIEQREGVLLPAEMKLEVTALSDSVPGNGMADNETSDGVEIDEIKIADIVAGEHTVSESQQVKQLKNILMEYYGLAENQVQVVMV